MKKIICSVLLFVLLFTTCFESFALENSSVEVSGDNEYNIDLSARSALLMEAKTGEILYSKNEDEKASPASVTKVMTLLLAMEAIRDGRVSAEDNVCISSNAASMGGSQVFLEEGEYMSLRELIKCAVIASANDAALAIAEHVSGSEGAFVAAMNNRAKELKMENTSFENVTGLDDTVTEHYTTARDIAIMSRELIKYDMILEYSSLWQDTIRGGEFTLTNTNRLVRYYDGCTGLKTGSTDKAGYCISATAKRDGVELIAVIMGAPTRDGRNADARALLDFGFSNFTLYEVPEKAIERLSVLRGTKDGTVIYSSAFSALIKKKDLKNVELIYDIPKELNAPLADGDKIGSITYKISDEIIGTSDIYVRESIEKISFIDVFLKIIKCIFTG
jgi:D-alanyl-D-alanine carboxypeptidase (penicillin-binding protein 5/6)